MATAFKSKIWQRHAAKHFCKRSRQPQQQLQQQQQQQQQQQRQQLLQHATHAVQHGTSSCSCSDNFGRQGLRTHCAAFAFA